MKMVTVTQTTMKFSNGVCMPLVGMGTWQITEKEELTKTLKAAIKVGYRHFDTAHMFGNEEAIGNFFHELFAEGEIRREDIFITTKLPFHCHVPKDAEEVIMNQLRLLKVDYIDLYLINNACSQNPFYNFSTEKNGEYVCDKTPHIETWRVLEDFYKKQRFRAIGLSNFRCDQIQDLYDKAEVKPHNVQVFGLSISNINTFQVELHIFNRQRKLLELCQKLDIKVTSFATLGSHNRLTVFGPGDWPTIECLYFPVVVDLAFEYKRSRAQILLRHMIQQGIAVIPKSTDPQHIEENFNIFDFTIKNEDMALFDADTIPKYRFFPFSTIKHHPQYPPFDE